MRGLRLLIAVVCACALSAALAPAAPAATLFEYTTFLDLTGVSHPSAGGAVGISGLDASKDTKVTVRPPSGTGTSITQGNTLTSFNFPHTAGVAPGDLVEVRQPSTSIAPTETYAIPSFSLSLVNGASTISGSVPAGMIGVLGGDQRCNAKPDPHEFPGGAFSVTYPKILPGERIDYSLRNADGNDVYASAASPGETPCVVVRSEGTGAVPPGTPPESTPYFLQVGHLIASQGGPSVRAVLRRGNTPLTDTSADSTSVNASFATQPQPGDIVDIYRPKTAASPTFTMTVPQVTGKFDPSVDLVAVDAPAAYSIETRFCPPFICNASNSRGAIGTAAGRTLFDFSKPDTSVPAADLQPDSIVTIEYYNSENTFDFSARAAPGDLVAPVQSFKLSNKLKLASLVKALKKGYKIKLKSNEAGTAKLTLGKLASARSSVKAGSNNITLKFSKSGKRAVRKLAAKKHPKSLSVTLTSVVTDSSGNASTFGKKTKIKP